MAELPKIVRQRLKLGESADVHPDADLLTAFAEQSLAANERAQLMQHLARCGDCREIVSLALPEPSQVAAIRAGDGRDWLRWPALRWSAVAAGIVAVVSVATFEYQRQTFPSAARRIEVQRQSDSGPEQAAAKLEAPSAAQRSANEKQPESKSRAELTAKKVAPLAGEVLAAPSGSAAPAGTVVGGAAGVAAGSSAAGTFKIATKEPPRELDFARAKNSSSQFSPKMSAPSAPQASPHAATSASSQRVEVTSAAPTADTSSARMVQNQVVQGAPNSGRETLSLAQNEVVDKDETVGKAKPIQPPASPAPMPPVRADAAVLRKAANPLWTISPAGTLQRSLDGGTTWAEVNPGSTISAGTSRGAAVAEGTMDASKTIPAPNAVFRAVVSNGAEVWAGGSPGLLYHSVDGGDHWLRVIPSASNVPLTGDIIRIQFSDMQHGKVATSNGEIWVTGDDGRTWQKQP